MDATSDHRLPMFVKKSNDEGIGFYYVGDVTPDKTSFTESVIGKGTSVVEMDLLLDTPVEQSLYEYLSGY